jgi:hypothetical protein
MNKLGVDYDENSKCILNNFTQGTLSPSEDTIFFQKLKVHSIPAIYINNIKYKVKIF